MKRFLTSAAALLLAIIPALAQTPGGASIGMSGSGTSKQFQVLDGPGGQFLPFLDVDAVNHTARLKPVAMPAIGGDLTCAAGTATCAITKVGKVAADQMTVSIGGATKALSSFLSAIPSANIAPGTLTGDFVFGSGFGYYNGLTQLDANANNLKGPLNLALSNQSILNLNGENISLFNVIPAYGWEKRDGTRSAPITTGGPSLKVSRVENIPISQCNGVFNENACNAAIYGSSSQDYTGNSPMQINGVLGTAMVYASNNDGEGVGVQGVSRAVGAATAGISGGYFEARYDSTATRSYFYTIGVEARVNNLTGRDAVPDVVGGNNYDVFLASCGGGPAAPATKCNADFMAIADSAQAFYGYVVAQGAVSDAGFYDPSSSTSAVRVRGSHTYQVDGVNFAVLGNGDLQVVTPDSSQAYLASTGAHSAFLSLDNQTGGQQDVIAFLDASAMKWQFGKDSNNSFFLYDSAASTTMIRAISGTSLTMGEPGKVTNLLGTLQANGIPGVSCTGALTSSAIITNGLVTHC